MWQTSRSGSWNLRVASSLFTIESGLMAEIGRRFAGAFRWRRCPDRCLRHRVSAMAALSPSQIADAHEGLPQACLAVRGKLDAYVDGEVSEIEASEVLAHVTVCPRCRREEESLRRFLSAVRHSQLPVLASRRVRLRIAECSPRRNKQATRRYRRPPPYHVASRLHSGPDRWRRSSGAHPPPRFLRRAVSTLPWWIAHTSRARSRVLNT